MFHIPKLMKSFQLLLCILHCSNFVHAGSIQCLGSDTQPLIKAVEGGNIHKVQELVQDMAYEELTQRKEQTFCDDLGHNAFTLAAKKGQLEIMKVLVNKLEDLKNDQFVREFVRKIRSGRTQDLYLVHWAAFSDKKDYSSGLLEYLVTKNANINSTTSKGYTPLHWAAMRPGNHKIVQEIIDNGGDLHAKAVDSWDPKDPGTLTALKLAKRHNIEKKNDATVVALANAIGAEKERLSQNENCVICLTGKKAFAILPCGHRCFCKACNRSPNMPDSFPMCRGPIESTLEIFN